MALEAKKTVDVRTSLVNHFTTVFGTMLNNEFKFKCNQSNHQITPIEPPTPVALASSLSVSCPAFTGTLILGFSEKAFVSIVNTMFGESLSTITKDYQDFAAEMLNMSFGKAKSRFNQETSMTLEPAIPVVIEGSNMKMSLAKECTNWEAKYTSTEGHGEIICILSLSPEK